MVTLIIEQEEKRYKQQIRLLKKTFEQPCEKHTLFAIITQDYGWGLADHIYEARCDWTVKIADDKLFIISERISSVIDLTKEYVYEIRVKHF